VSIKYISHLPGRFHAFEIRVGADIRHGSENLGKAPPAGASECRGEDRPMFGLRATTVGAGPLLQRTHKRVIDTTYQ
jgi:hypothetical protein